jgi:hypothetical protein
MSMRQLPEPCWMIHNPHGWDHPQAVIAVSHYPDHDAAQHAAARAMADDLANPNPYRGLLAVPHPHRCWEIRCDECGAIATDPDDDRDHFDTPHAALDQVPDWRTDRRGTPSLCEACAAEAECADYGHTFDAWRGCVCGGRKPEHAEGCPQFRTCIVCGEDDDPAYPDTTHQTAERAVA